MKHWSDKIDLDAAVTVAETLNIDWAKSHDKRTLIEDVMVRLMKVIREPWFKSSAHYDAAVDFYLAVHRAVNSSGGNCALGGANLQPGGG
jgi:hypothetical protein